jgi:ABC-type nitrate/sulfonate/bicarbonate transport system substrate-binding protein
MFRALLATLSFLVILVLPRLGYTQSIRISYAGTSSYNVPIWVTHEAGLFKKHGLNSELIMIAGAAQSMQAMLANELNSNPQVHAIIKLKVLIRAKPVIYRVYRWLYCAKSARVGDSSFW